MEKSVYVVLVQWGKADLTIDCIKSLFESTYTNLHIVIVDNASPDDSLNIIRKYEGEKVKVITAKTKNGFSAGNNLGIKYAIRCKADYILLLNNDTVVDKNLVNDLVENCNDHCITVPKIYYYSKPDIIWYAGGNINYKTGRAYHIGQDEPDSPEYSKKREVDFATGCCLLIPHSIITNVGLMDESYFLYWEDVDYSLRFRNKGYKIIFCPDAKVWHKVNSSTGTQSKVSLYYGNRNRLYVTKKYNFGFIPFSIALSTRLILFAKGCIKNSNEKIIGKAISDFYKGVRGKVPYV